MVAIMKDNNIFVFGDKEYTREELIQIGKEHRSKKYWTTRAVGLGLILLGFSNLLSYVINGVIYLCLKNPAFAVVGIVYLVIAGIFFMMMVAGLIVVLISFKRRPDDEYIKNAKVYLTKVAARDKRVAAKKEANNIKMMMRYKKLLDTGVITQEEYDAKKKEYLE